MSAFILMGSFSGMKAAEESSPNNNAMDSKTIVLKWKDGKKAVFMLEFDDSAPSAIKNAMPELIKRKMVGTFYINPGNPPYKSLKGEWEKACLEEGIEYANHTFTHVGATSSAQLDDELNKCNEEIYKCYPNRKQPRLISFGQPGGVPWTISPAEKKELLAKYNLVERPAFFGYPFQIKTQEALLALVDKALASGEMGHHDFHGVGGDWLVTPMEMFTALLDKLEANRDQLWITDPVSWHKYQTERAGAEVKMIKADQNNIVILLSCAADPVLYDMPLTLSTQVPPGWKECEVVQGTTRTTVAATDNTILYSALPGKDEISIKPISK